MQQDDAFDNFLLRRTRTEKAEADKQTANSASSSSVVQKMHFSKKNFFLLFSPSRSSEFLKTFKGSRSCSTIKQNLNATSLGGHNKVEMSLRSKNNKVERQKGRTTIRSKDHKAERP